MDIMVTRFERLNCPFGVHPLGHSWTICGRVCRVLIGHQFSVHWAVT